jgi:hypothetical protein
MLKRPTVRDFRIKKETLISLLILMVAWTVYGADGSRSKGFELFFIFQNREFTGKKQGYA